MNNFLTKILNSNEYNVIESIKLKLFGNGHEFFLIEKFEVEEFKNFFTCEKLDCLISEFQSLENDKIKNNTSLFVLVEVADMQEFYNQYLNTIVAIEEDEYYFRKYVIFYTKEVLDKLNPDNQFLLDYIQHEIDEESSRFDLFEENMFFDDAYFVAMQVIVKLPFISIPILTYTLKQLRIE